MNLMFILGSGCSNTFLQVPSWSWDISSFGICGCGWKMLKVSVILSVLSPRWPWTLWSFLGETFIIGSQLGPCLWAFGSHKSRRNALCEWLFYSFYGTIVDHLCKFRCETGSGFAAPNWWSDILLASRCSKERSPSLRSKAASGERTSMIFGWSNNDWQIWGFLP